MAFVDPKFEKLSDVVLFLLSKVNSPFEEIDSESVILGTPSKHVRVSLSHRNQCYETLHLTCRDGMDVSDFTINFAVVDTTGTPGGWLSSESMRFWKLVPDVDAIGKKVRKILTFAGFPSHKHDIAQLLLEQAGKFLKKQDWQVQLVGMRQLASLHFPSKERLTKLLAVLAGDYVPNETMSVCDLGELLLYIASYLD